MWTLFDCLLCGGLELRVLLSFALGQITSTIYVGDIAGLQSFCSAGSLVLGFQAGERRPNSLVFPDALRIGDCGRRAIILLQH